MTLCVLRCVCPPQWRTDFLNSRVLIPMNHGAQEECLGLAVLDMMRLAKESGRSPVSICNDTRWEVLTHARTHTHMRSHGDGDGETKHSAQTVMVGSDASNLISHSLLCTCVIQSTDQDLRAA